jgi:S1-C subfamily serine protease
MSNILKVFLSLVIFVKEVRAYSMPYCSTMNRRHLLQTTFSIIPATVLLRSNSVFAFTQQESDHIKLYEKVVPSVCYIETEYEKITKQPLQQVPKGIGTGFVWDTQGHIVTNFHVISKVERAVVRLANNNGEIVEYIPKLTGIDPDKDIAVLKIDVKSTVDLRPIVLNSNDCIKIGQYAFAIGNPFGKELSFSMGIISGKFRELNAPSGRKIKDVIQTDADVNPGNSGGPLLDSDGKLIGMNTATMGMGVSSGVNFALSVDMIKNTVTQIIQKGTIPRAALGISYLENNPSASEAQNAGLPFVEKGVIVLNVPKNSPSYASGLQGADVIVGIDDYDISRPIDLLDTLEHYKPGDKIKLHILRNIITPKTLDVTLGSFSMSTFSNLQRELL